MNKKTETRITQACAIAIARGLKPEIDLEEQLVSLSRDAASALLNFSEDYIELEMIKVKPTERHKHHGSLMLADIVAIADHLHLNITLVAASMKHSHVSGLCQTKLKKWYRRYGFEDSGVYMRRIFIKPAEKHTAEMPSVVATP